jgi:HEAT repeat protein
MLAFALFALIAPFDAPAQTASKRSPHEADIALLRALLYAFEPAPREIRIIATEDLALLGDPRALDALAHLVFDRDPEVARAAVRAVARFRHPRADQMLGNIIWHPALPETLKVIAVEGLPFQDSARSRELLKEISGSGVVSAPLRNAARNTLERMAATDPVTPR